MSVDQAYLDRQDEMDRLDEARQAAVDGIDEPCSCAHPPESHTPGNGCETRWCTCGWWGP